MAVSCSIQFFGKAAAMSADSLVLTETPSLLDRGFYCRRWQRLLLTRVVKLLLSEVVAAVTMDYDDFLFW